MKGAAARGSFSLEDGIASSDSSKALSARQGKVLSDRIDALELEIRSNGLQNRIINGNFDVWQRGTLFSNVQNSVLADRWRLRTVGSTAQWQAQSHSDVPPVSVSPFSSSQSLKLLVTANDTVMDLGDYVALVYRFEGSDFQSLRGGKATVQFCIKTSVPGIYCVSFRNDVSGSATRSYVTEVTVDNPNVWQRVRVTADLADLVGPWGIGSALGAEMTITLLAGFNWQTVSNTWQAGDFLATSAQCNAAFALNNTVFVSQVQVVDGETVGDFTPAGATIAQETEMCQRYFEKSYDMGTVPGTASMLGRNLDHSVGTSWQLSTRFTTRKRTTPIVAVYSPNTGAVGMAYAEDGAADFSASISSQSQTGFVVSGTISPGNSHGSVQWTADAEL